MKIAMPIVENQGKGSRIHPHFGQIQFLAVYDSEKKELKIVPVKPIQGCSPVAALEGLGVDAIYTWGMGMRAMQLCTQRGIKLKTGRFETVEGVIQNLDKLEDLEESCGH
ncbi:unnamed protein product [marine sediment metagenome]|uniref:Dinitrogenase iron-molybdenum cofactor biosynthesis domain-containing protein n=1 Tax=marine sediment metagenome TaxID=412755 RepID=X0U602_9ZZZZ